MLRRVEPQHILAVIFHRVLTGAHAAAVVAADLGIARATVRRADVFVLHIDARRGRAAVVCRVVGARRAEDDHKFVVLGRQNRERDLIAEDERPDIHRSARRGGNPVAIRLNHSLDRREEQVSRQLRDAHALIRAGHTLDVHVRPENLDAAVRRAVGLHALKHHLCVVQHAGRRLDEERLVRYNAPVVPALSFVIVHDEHVVGEVFRKAQLRLVGRTGLGVRSPYHREVVFHFSFLLMFIVHIKAVCRGGASIRPDRAPPSGRERH